MPVVEISKKFLDGLRRSPNPDKRTEYRDNSLTGLVAVHQTSGRVQFMCRYVRGKSIGLGSYPAVGVETARTLAAKAISDYRLGVDPLEERRTVAKESAKLTLDEFMRETYNPWSALNHKRDDSYSRLRAGFPSLLSMPIEQITAADIGADILKRKEAGLSAGTLNRERATLRAVFSKAMQERVITVHPMANRQVRQEKEDSQGNIRFLRPDESERLDEALARLPVGHRLRVLVPFARLTGCRWGEMVKLTWAGVDLPARRLTIAGHNAKSGQTRHIPINQKLLGILEEWHELNGKPDSDQLVFPGKLGVDGEVKLLDNVTRSFKTLIKDAKITEKLRWHDLRHDFASQLIQKGVTLHTAQKLLGHSTIRLTERYSHHNADHLVEAVDLL